MAADVNEGVSIVMANISTGTVVANALIRLRTEYCMKDYPECRKSIPAK